MNERRCENCRFYREMPNDDTEWTRWGFCHRNPPAVAVVEDFKILTYYPEVQPLWWCGEWQQHPDGTLHWSARHGLSIRTRKALIRLGIGSLKELSERTAAELLAVRNFGNKGLSEIKKLLDSYGMQLRQ
jgi:hypothetical protein